MNQKKQRILASVMTVIMVFSLFAGVPVSSAFATQNTSIPEISEQIADLPQLTADLPEKTLDVSMTPTQKTGALQAYVLDGASYVPITGDLMMTTNDYKTIQLWQNGANITDYSAVSMTKPGSIPSTISIFPKTTDISISTKNDTCYDDITFTVGSDTCIVKLNVQGGGQPPSDTLQAYVFDGASYVPLTSDLMMTTNDSKTIQLWQNGVNITDYSAVSIAKPGSIPSTISITSNTSDISISTQTDTCYGDITFTVGSDTCIVKLNVQGGSQPPSGALQAYVLDGASYIPLTSDLTMTTNDTKSIQLWQNGANITDYTAVSITKPGSIPSTISIFPKTTDISISTQNDTCYGDITFTVGSDSCIVKLNVQGGQPPLDGFTIATTQDGINYTPIFNELVTEQNQETTIQIWQDGANITDYSNVSISHNGPSDLVFTTNVAEKNINVKTGYDYRQSNITFHVASSSFDIALFMNGKDCHPSYSIKIGDGTFSTPESYMNNITLNQGQTAQIKIAVDGVPATDTISTEWKNGSDGLTAVITDDIITITAPSNEVAGLYLTVNVQSSSTTVYVSVRPTKPETNYAASIKQGAFVGDTETLVFNDTTGVLATPSAGFTLAGTTLSFDTTGKTQGSYVATVGDKNYIVTMLNQTIGSFDRSITVDLTVPNTNNIPHHQNGIYIGNGEFGSTQLNIPIYNRVATPLYIINFENNNIVEFPADYELSIYSEFANAFIIDTVKIDNVDVYRLYPNKDVDSHISFCNGTLYSNTGTSASVDFRKTDSDDYTNHTKSYSLYKDTVLPYNYPNLYIDVNSTDSLTTDIFFGLKFGSFLENTVEPALDDVIDVSTLKIESDKPDIFTIEEVLTKTTDNKSAIGFRLKVNNYTEKKTAALKISFQEIGSDQTKFIYLGLVVKDPTPTAPVFTVSTPAEYMDAYNNLNPAIDSVIEFKAGTYPINILSKENLVLRAVEGEKVIITGDPTTPNKPIVTFRNSQSKGIFGITFDGGGTRVGIQVSHDGVLQGYVKDCIIQNCTTGIITSNLSYAATNISFSIIRNCDIGIRILGWAPLGENTFTNNRIAIQNELTEGFEGTNESKVRIEQNTFSLNGVDINNKTTLNLPIRYNFFDYPDNNYVPTITKQPTGHVKYSPFYADAELTMLSADIAGSEIKAPITRNTSKTKNIIVPFDILQASSATLTKLFDDALFQEMKTSSDNISVDLPVTVMIDNKPVVSTIWAFNNNTGMLATDLPANMNLEVTDTLSPEAQAIVDKTVANKDDIVQGVNFTHDGVLPGTSTVKIIKTADVDIDNLKLFYINETTGTVEEATIIDVTEQTIDGVVYYVITVDHCSEYIITTDVTLVVPEPTTTPEPTTEPEATPTPDENRPVAPTPSPTPNAPVSANDFTSNREIADKFNNAATDTVNIDIDAKPLLSTTAFDLLLENSDKELLLQGDEYSWTFKGSDITDPNAISGASFDTSISLTSPNEKEISAKASKIAADAKLINLYFSYHGELPGKASITVNVGTENAGTTQHLYYFNQYTSEFESLGDCTVDADGDVTFEISHCSDYILSDTMLHEKGTETPDKEDPTPTEPPKDSSDTDLVDTTPNEKASSGTLIIVLSVALVVVIILGIVIVIKKKNKAE